jgi:hypothetical protein
MVQRPVTNKEAQAIGFWTQCGAPAALIAENLGRSVSTVGHWRAALKVINVPRVRVRTSCLSFTTETFQVLDQFANERGMKFTRAISVVCEATVRKNLLDQVVPLKPLPPRMQASVELRSPRATVGLAAPTFAATL